MGGEATPQAEAAPKPKQAQKQRAGVVISNKADKTISVEVELKRPHPVYHKVIKRSRTLHAHDERNEAHEGDRVLLVECRPLSRSKRWRLVEIIERAR